MTYRTELIQTAAVVVSMVCDLDYGIADSTAPHPAGGFLEQHIWDDISRERLRQDAKWGPIHHDPPMWFTILMEEVGKAAQAYLHELEDLEA